MQNRQRRALAILDRLKPNIHAITSVLPRQIASLLADRYAHRRRGDLERGRGAVSR
jgi:hypothetical protein